MKGLRGDIDSDKVDDIMDEIQEEKDIHDSISEAISRPGQDLFNDEELLEELAELDALELEEQEQVQAQQQHAPAPAVRQAAPAAPQSVFNLPSVPTSSVAPRQQQYQQPPAESEDERALRELQASMLA